MKKAASITSLTAVVGALVAVRTRRQRPTQPATDSLLTNRTARRFRVWKLTARNTARYAFMRTRGLASPAERRAELDEQFALRTAADVASELGEMKGVLMKAGQMISFIVEILPDEAQAALATLQANAAPMAPTLAAGVVAAELGAPPERVFLEWSDTPVAAASIGQVHRAITPTGRTIAVKVQYPGVAEAIESDLEAVEKMYAVFSAMKLKGLDVPSVVEELRGRMREELDYRLEAQNLREFAQIYAGHPWVRIPRLVERYSTAHVLSTEWIDGQSFDEFRRTASPDTKQRAAEVIWRFVQNSIFRHGVFNGDPHPGNYKFHHDGSVTFLDFGLVKRWHPGEWDLLRPTVDAIVIHRDPERLVAAMEASGFLRPDHDVDPQRVFDYISSPYEPYLVDEFTFTREWMRDTLTRIFDADGTYKDVVAALNMPASYVILDRVVWGVSAILGKLNASGPFRAMLLEYLLGTPSATELGAAETAWGSIWGSSRS